jgi:hypothetical protein
VWEFPYTHHTQVAINSDITTCSSLILCVRHIAIRNFTLKQFIVTITQRIQTTHLYKRSEIFPKEKVYVGAGISIFRLFG